MSARSLLNSRKRLLSTAAQASSASSALRSSGTSASGRVLLPASAQRTTASGGLSAALSLRSSAGFHASSRSLEQHATTREPIDTPPDLFCFTEEEEMLRESVRKFAEDVVGPKVMEMDEKEQMDPDVIKEMFDQGVSTSERARATIRKQQGAIVTGTDATPM